MFIQFILKLLSSRVICSSILLVLFLVPSYFEAAEKRIDDALTARVVEIDGKVEARYAEGSSRYLKYDDAIALGAQLKIHEEGWIVLMMNDGAVRKFMGPATITFSHNVKKNKKNIVFRLSENILKILFKRDEEKHDAIMATRGFDGEEEPAIHIPMLFFPASGECLLEKPEKLRWHKIKGVSLYRISVFSADRLLWKGTTKNSIIRCPPEKLTSPSGELYYWVVEALMGDSTFISKASYFKILPQETQSNFLNALRDVDTVCHDAGLNVSIKVKLCLNLNVYSEALKIIELCPDKELLGGKHHLLRADVHEKMGYYKEAYFDLRKALNGFSIP